MSKALADALAELEVKRKALVAAERLVSELTHERDMLRHLLADKGESGKYTRLCLAAFQLAIGWSDTARDLEKGYDREELVEARMYEWCSNELRAVLAQDYGAEAV